MNLNGVNSFSLLQHINTYIYTKSLKEKKKRQANFIMEKIIQNNKINTKQITTKCETVN